MNCTKLNKSLFPLRESASVYLTKFFSTLHLTEIQEAFVTEQPMFINVTQYMYSLAVYMLSVLTPG